MELVKTVKGKVTWGKTRRFFLGGARCFFWILDIRTLFFL